MGKIVYMDTTHLYEGLSWADWLLYLMIAYAVYYFSSKLFKKAFGKNWEDEA